MSEFADILCCKIGCLLLTSPTLVLPLGVSFKAKLLWNPFIEKIEHKLSGWKKL